MAFLKEEKKNLLFVMLLLLCGDYYVNMPGLRYYTVHYRDEFITGAQLHLLGALGAESAELDQWEAEQCPGFRSK